MWNVWAPLGLSALFCLYIWYPLFVKQEKWSRKFTFSILFLTAMLLCLGAVENMNWFFTLSSAEQKALTRNSDFSWHGFKNALFYTTWLFSWPFSIAFLAEILRDLFRATGKGLDSLQKKDGKAGLGRREKAWFLKRTGSSRTNLNELDSLRLFRDRYAEEKIEALRKLLKEKEGRRDRVLEQRQRWEHELGAIPDNLLDKRRYQPLLRSLDAKNVEKRDECLELELAIEGAVEEKRRLDAHIKVSELSRETVALNESLRNENEETTAAIGQAKIAAETISAFYNRFFNLERQSAAQIGGYEQDPEEVQAILRASLQAQVAQEERLATTGFLVQSS